MYKVGDYIRIVRVAERYKKSSEYDHFLSNVGNVHKVLRVEDDCVYLDSLLHYVWDFDEIEHAKDYIVHNLIKNL